MFTYKTKEYTLSCEEVTCFGKTGLSICNFKPRWKIKHLVLPNTINGLNVVKINDLAFFKNGSSHITLPESLVLIGSSAFASNEYLKEIIFPKSLYMIDSSAFRNCESLEEVRFNEGLTIIRSDAFRCAKIKDVNLPDSLNFIGSYTFSNNRSKTVSFGSQLESIGPSAFSLNDFQTVKLPETLKRFYGDTFGNNDFLESIYIGENARCLNTYEYFLHACNKLKNIVVSPNNLFYTSINRIIYDKDEGVIVRVPPEIETSTIVIPSWVKRMSPGCFHGVPSKRVIIKAPDILGIEKACIRPSINIACIKDSELENKLKKLGYKNISSSNSQIDEFINLISEEQNIKSDKNI